MKNVHTLARRNFLRSMIAAAATSSLMLRPSFGHEYTKVEPMARCLASARRLAANATLDQNSRRSLRLMNTRMTDELLGLMMDTFQEECSDEDVRRIFRNGYRGLIQSGDLSGLASGVVPVGIMRELMHDYRLSFASNECVNWPRFAARYSKALSDNF